MQARANSHQRFTSDAHRNKTQRCCHVERLEGRTLLSFSTINAVSGFNDSGMAADAIGNVYVAGIYTTGTGTFEDRVRESSDGGTTWTTILTKPDGALGFEREIAASPAGDVYAAVQNRTAPYGWSILERPAGGTQFSPVFSSPYGSSGKLSVDATGKAYAIGDVPVTVTGAGGKTSIVARNAVVRQAGAMGTFATVDIFPGVVAEVCATTQGVYAVGQSTTSPVSWIVRRSPTGDPGTWSTVDNFQFDPINNGGSAAQLVTVDKWGKVFVEGVGSKKVRTGGTNRNPIYTTTSYRLLRTSSNGGASWTTPEQLAWPESDTIGNDAAGNLYIGGYQDGPTGNTGAFLHMKPAGGGAWVSVDQSSTYAAAYGFTADSNGNLYVAGESDAAGGFVDKMPAPTLAPAVATAAPLAAPLPAFPPGAA